MDTRLGEEIQRVKTGIKNSFKFEIRKNKDKNKTIEAAITRTEAIRYDERGIIDEDVENIENIHNKYFFNEEEETNMKRAINIQIEKNKGLTPKRNKLYKNPRVKHRQKYRKALVKRKSIVPSVRTEVKRYSGESTGIRSNVIRAVKLK